MKFFLRTILFFGMVAFQSFEIAAQESTVSQRVDSLKKELFKVNSDTSQVLIYTQLARTLYNKDTSSSLFYSQKALDISKKNNYLKGLAEGFNALGWVREYQGNYSKALGLYEEALKIHEKDKDFRGMTRALNDIGIAQNSLGNLKESIIAYQKAHDIYNEIKDDRGKALTLNNLGLSYLALANYDKALKSLFEALSLNQKINSKGELGANYNNIGDTYEAQGDLEQALHYQLKASEISKELDDKHTLVAAYISVGYIYIRKNELEKSQIYLEKALAFAHEIADISKEAITLGYLAELYEKRGLYKKAIENFTKALEMHKETGDKQNISLILLGLGRTHLASNNYENSKRYLIESVALSASIGARRIESQAMGVLANLHEETGNLSQSIQLYKKIKTLNDSIFTKESAEKIAQMQAMFETEEKERENTALRKEKEAQSKIIDLQRKDAQLEKWIRYAMFGILGLVGLLTLVFYKGRQKQKAANNELFQKNQEILQKKEEIEAILEEMKQTNEILSLQKLKLEELNSEKDGLVGIVAHDLKSPLNRTKALVKMLSLEGELNEMQKKYVEMIENEAENGRKLIRDLLDTSALEHHGSKISISEFDMYELCNELLESYQQTAIDKQIKLNFISIDNQLIKIKSDRDFLRRILDNLLSNAIKFSPKNKNVYLQTEVVDESHILIHVKDEGIGFTEEDMQKMFKKFQKLSAKPTGGESSTGLGLSIIKSLVEKLDGEIEVKSEWQKGAEFIIKLPLDIH